VITNYRPCRQGVRKIGDIAPPFLISAQDGYEWSSSRHCRFTPREESPVPVCNGRLGGPQSRSGRCRVEENLALVRNRTSAAESFPHRYTDWAIPVLSIKSTVTCRGCCVTYNTSSDWMIGFIDTIFIHTTRHYRQIQRHCYSTHITVHCCTRTRILSLH
jgi:hypothetical protein